MVGTKKVRCLSTNLNLFGKHHTTIQRSPPALSSTPKLIIEQALHKTTAEHPSKRLGWTIGKLRTTLRFLKSSQHPCWWYGSIVFWVRRRPYAEASCFIKDQSIWCLLYKIPYSLYISLARINILLQSRKELSKHMRPGHTHPSPQLQVHCAPLSELHPVANWIVQVQMPHQPPQLASPPTVR